MTDAKPIDDGITDATAILQRNIDAKPDAGALVPVAYVVQSLRDGSISNRIAPTAWASFEQEKAKLEQDAWISHGAAKLAPLYSHETILALQSEVARLTRQNDDHAAYIAGIERERDRLAGEVAARNAKIRRLEWTIEALDNGGPR